MKVREKKSGKKRIEQRKIYEKCHQKILVEFANIENLKVIKSSDGAYDSIKDGLFDGIYISGETMTGVAAVDVPNVTIITLENYMMRIAREVIEGYVNKVIVFLVNANNVEEIRKKITTNFNILKDNPLDRISIIDVNIGDIEEKIKNLNL